MSAAFKKKFLELIGEDETIREDGYWREKYDEMHTRNKFRQDLRKKVENE